MATGVFTHSLTTGYKSDEGTITSVVQSFTGDAEVGIESAIAVGITNQHFVVAVTVSQIVIHVIAAVGEGMTIKTNSSTTPQDTITLAAGAQLVWYPASAAANFFTGNVTGFYVSNTGTKNGNFKYRALLNA